MIRLGVLIGTMQIGGAELQLLRLIKNIDQEIFKIFVFTMKSPGPLASQLIESGVEVHSLNISKKMIIKSLINFYNQLKFHKLDILYCVLFDSIVLGGIVGRLAGVKRIVGGVRGLGKTWTRKQIWGLRFVQLIISSFVVNSDAIKRMCVKREWIMPHKVVVIPNGIDLSKFQYTPEKENVIGIVASLKPIKGQVQFIKAANLLLKKRFDHQFILLGDGPDRYDLTKLVESLGWKNNILFTGNVNNVCDYVKKFKIIVSSSAFEGLSNSILEAMSVGSPVVASNVSSNNEIITDMFNGVLYEFGNEKDLASKIEILCQDSVLYNHIAQNALKTVKSSYSLDKMVRTTEEFFQRLIKK